MIDWPNVGVTPPEILADWQSTKRKYDRAGKSHTSAFEKQSDELQAKRLAALPKDREFTTQEALKMWGLKPGADTARHYLNTLRNRGVVERTRCINWAWYWRVVG